MPSYSIDLSNYIEETKTDMNRLETLLSFSESIYDAELKKMLISFPIITNIAERSLQSGNIRRAEKYILLLNRIVKETYKRKDRCIEELEKKILTKS